MALLDRESGVDEWLGVDAHEHQSVTEPLLDADTEQGSHLTHRGAKDLQLLDGTLVAVVSPV
ncbi:MAG: hypothetical protein ACRD03_08830 [Acidimicrobiales bacterium]